MSVGRLIKENAALVVGISLPVVVVVFFLLASYIPRLLVDPPGYDFVFAQGYGYSNSQSRLRHEIDVDSDRGLRVRAFLTEPEKYAPRARLFRYEHAGGSIREISLPTPESDDVPEAGLIVEIPEFRGAFIDQSRLAPDGYEFLEPRRSMGGFLGLFYRGNRRGLAIGKSGAVVAIPAGDGLNYYSVRFLGWVVAGPEQQ